MWGKAQGGEVGDPGGAYGAAASLKHGGEGSCRVCLADSWPVEGKLCHAAQQRHCFLLHACTIMLPPVATLLLMMSFKGLRTKQNLPLSFIEKHVSHPGKSSRSGQPKLLHLCACEQIAEEVEVKCTALYVIDKADKPAQSDCKLQSWQLSICTGYRF